MSESFWHLLRTRVENRPGHPAIIHGKRQVTFAELFHRSQQYACWFRGHLARGDRVLVWMNSSPEMAAALMGIWKCGGICALMDPRAKADHFLHAIDTIAARFIVVDSLGMLPTDAPVTVLTPDMVATMDGDGQPPVDTLTVEPASIVFTSGSTGRPKAVTQSHGNLLRGCRSVTGYLGLTSSDRIVCTVPWSFDYGFGQLLSTIMTGAAHILPLPANPFGMCQAIEEHRPTVIAGVPSVFTYLLRGVSPIRSTDLSSVQTLTNTGGTIPAPVLRDLFDLFPGRRMFLNYGLTETYRTTYLDPSLAEKHPTSIGRAIPGAAIAVVREDGTIADTDEIGEIVHRGDFICLGYWNDPEATAKVIRPDPLAVAGCSRPPMAVFTGDLGRIDGQGLLYFCGRRDRQLKPMGVRVNPSEIEETLYGSKLVSEVAVVGRKHELLVDELWALVVPAQSDTDERALIQRLRDYGRAMLSPYMMPQRFVVRSTLPKTTSGKVDYPRLVSEIGNQR
jgi:acyl-CoA synthetase (AMP-forming)/AMP-acid ligase II